jgi:starch-binding outer membrane protein, SusD/RagB family
MKKLSYIAVLFALGALGSCSKQLDQQPVSSVTSENFYLNTSDFLQAVNGVYSRLKAYPNQALWLGEVRSDNVTAASDGNRDWQGIENFSPNLTTTDFIEDGWNNDFNAIFNANSVLEALGAKGSNITDAALRSRLEAEVRFLRAFYYFDLVRTYGRVPVLDKPLAPQDVATVDRSPVAEVYNFIIRDLEAAAAVLPPAYSGANVGRATAGAAKSLLGLVYLTKSGPVYDPEVDGPGQNSNEWGKAVALFNEVIASNQYQFLSGYPDIFSYTNENNKEVIFDVQFMLTNSGAGFPSQLVPSGFWDAQGLSNYGNGYGSGSYNVSTNLLDSYRNSAGGKVDRRDTFSIRHSFPTSTAVNAPVDTTRPFLKKYIDQSRRGKDRADWPINFIVIRYTDVLMMKAEAMLHGAPGTQAEVDALVNQVRARAGLDPVANVTLEQLMEERRREFAGEGLRWNDLVRSGMAVTTMNNFIASEKLTTVNPVIPAFTLYPVPAAELQAKPGLYTQNKGYY